MIEPLVCESVTFWTLLAWRTHHQKHYRDQNFCLGVSQFGCAVIFGSNHDIFIQCHLYVSILWYIAGKYTHIYLIFHTLKQKHNNSKIVLNWTFMILLYVVHFSYSDHLSSVTLLSQKTVVKLYMVSLDLYTSP